MYFVTNALLNDSNNLSSVKTQSRGRQGGRTTVSHLLNISNPGEPGWSLAIYKDPTL